jgi:hypothetical protein
MRVRFGRVQELNPPTAPLHEAQAHSGFVESAPVEKFASLVPPGVLGTTVTARWSLTSSVIW